MKQIRTNDNTSAQLRGETRAAVTADKADPSRPLEQPRIDPVGRTSRSSQFSSKGGRTALITGGAGFIGCNLAARLINNGYRVLVYDNLSRPGVERNLAWLQETFGRSVQVEVDDVRDTDALRHAVSQACRIYHFAAQVAVTTSLVDPLEDFEVNARGTLNVLEAARRLPHPPPVLFTSTNKVYGDLGNLELQSSGMRYMPVDAVIAKFGASERQPLDFHSPYGCSKGVADQYVLDYARCFGIPSVVFRMSCIYGPHQCGTEDQGWVAHFAMRALAGDPITLYGDGKQVRDLLFVEDLTAAMCLALDRIDATRGQAFNMGGGPDNSISLLELCELMGRIEGADPSLDFGPWRAGDQRYYVSDSRKFQQATGWRPQVGVSEGVARLFDWLRHNRAAIAAGTAVGEATA